MFQHKIMLQVAICHNEDTYPLIKKDGYFITAHIRDTKVNVDGNQEIIEEQFTHFAYPGTYTNHHI